MLLKTSLTKNFDQQTLLKLTTKHCLKLLKISDPKRLLNISDLKTILKFVIFKSYLKLLKITFKLIQNGYSNQSAHVTQTNPQLLLKVT